MPRGLSAALQEVRQPAAPCRLVSAPNLRSIKLVLKQSHRCDLRRLRARGERKAPPKRGWSCSLRIVKSQQKYPFGDR